MPSPKYTLTQGCDPRQRDTQSWPYHRPDVGTQERQTLQWSLECVGTSSISQAHQGPGLCHVHPQTSDDAYQVPRSRASLRSQVRGQASTSQILTQAPILVPASHHGPPKHPYRPKHLRGHTLYSHTFTHVHSHTCSHVWSHTCSHVHLLTCTHGGTLKHIWTHTCKHIYSHMHSLL